MRNDFGKLRILPSRCEVCLRRRRLGYRIKVCRPCLREEVVCHLNEIRLALAAQSQGSNAMVTAMGPMLMKLREDLGIDGSEQP